MPWPLIVIHDPINPAGCPVMKIRARSLAPISAPVMLSVPPPARVRDAKVSVALCPWAAGVKASVLALCRTVSAPAVSLKFAALPSFSTLSVPPSKMIDDASRRRLPLLAVAVLTKRSVAPLVIV